MRTNQSLLEEDVPRYRKKPKHSSPTKSKHKHDYQPCVFEYNCAVYTHVNGFSVQQDAVHAVMGTYCTVCGKVGGFNWTGMLDRGTLSEDDKLELNFETRTLPTFWLDDVFKQKFVILE